MIGVEFSASPANAGVQAGVRDWAPAFAGEGLALTLIAVSEALP